jgi:hypothetical protein
MRAVSKRRVLGMAVCATGVVASVLTAGPLSKAHAAVAPSFAPPITLPASTGGEPGIAIDTAHCSGVTCHIYVNSPNATSGGPGIWHSSDYGVTWGAATNIDTVAPCNPAPGGDTDADVLPNGSVTAADLNVSWATVQVSTDHAASFPACTETAFEDDRPWLTHKGNNTVYVAYHDFVLEVPIVCTSTTVSGTSAGTFTCVQAYGTGANPGPTGTQLTNCQENTVPARYIAIDPTDSSINFMYSCSTAAENAAAPPYGPLHDYFLAQSTNGITYTTKTVYVAPTGGGQKPNLANIFGNFHIDSAGNYYAVWVGSLDDSHILTGTPAGINDYHVYLTSSQDKGTTWTAPVAVDSLSGADGLGTRTLADFAVTTPGNIDLIWYGTPAVGEPNGQCGSTGQTHPCVDGTTQDGMDFTPAGGTNTGGPVPGNWKMYMAQSTNALSGSPSFTFSQIDPNFRHFGTICTNGIVCGGVSDRHLLDFTSVAVDCTGAAHVTYAADQNTPTAPALGDAARHDGALKTIEVNQNGGNLLAQPASCAQLATNVPELPLVPLLPLSAAVVGGMLALGHRRRHQLRIHGM